MSFLLKTILNYTQVGLAWFFGARFDLAFASIKAGNLTPPKDLSQAAAMASQYEGRPEL